ncbi:S41 family peptidase [Algoriphagus sp.]|uniref:S41 family peptidase n=1 Tax=Algoriphagus sp. TaxID=1872435 RepID=UPI0039195636
MRFLITILCIGITSSGSSFAQGTITKTQASEDIRFFNKTIQSKHPQPDKHFSNFEAYSDSLISVLPEILPMDEFTQMMAKYANKFQDGHTYIQNSEVLEDALFLPFELKIKEKKAFISKSMRSDADLKGAEIISINSIDFSLILKNALELAGGETVEHRLSRIERSFPFYLYRLLGDVLEMEVLIDKQIVKLSPKLIKRDEWLSLSNFNAIPKYHFQIMDDKVGLITFSDMAGIKKSEFNSFLKSTFKELSDKKIDKLIIDLRDNGGGNFLFGEMLLSYLSENPYTLQQKYQYDMQGAKVNQKMTQPIRPKSQKNRFSGELYFLTSPYTYSSAATIIAAAKYNSIGKIVGQAIGQPYSGFIDVTNFLLPHSKLTCGTSTVYYEYVGITEENATMGIPPDIFTDEDALELLLKEFE